MNGLRCLTNSILESLTIEKINIFIRNHVYSGVLAERRFAKILKHPSKDRDLSRTLQKFKIICPIVHEVYALMYDFLF